MKNKLFLLIIMIGLLFITACSFGSSKEKIVYQDINLKLTTTFEYNEDDGFKFERDVTGGKFAEIEFSNEKQNLYFDMYYTKSSKVSSEIQKKSRSSDKYYKEYKFGDYKAYTYGTYKDKLNIVIDINKTINGQKIELFIAISTIKEDKNIIVSDLFKKTVIQDFFKSIEITED